MYQYFATKRAPAAIWMLGDNSPYKECSGTGYAAQNVPSETVPTKSTPLVDGATNSSVVGGGKRIRFANKFLGRGHESRTFALEAWVLPVPRNYSEEIPILPTNMLPLGRVDTSDGVRTNSAVLWTSVASTEKVYVGTHSRKMTLVSSAGNAMAASAYGVGHDYTPSLSPVITGGKRYTIGYYAYTDTAGLRGNITHSVRDEAGVIQPNTTTGSDYVPLEAGKWTRVQTIWEAPMSGRMSVGLGVNRIDGATSSEGIITYFDAVYMYDGEWPDLGYVDGETPGYKWNGAPATSTASPKPDVSRVNLASNPNLATDSSGWLGTGGTVNAPWDTTRKAYQVTATASGTPYIFSGVVPSLLQKGTTVTASAMVKLPPNSKYYFRLHKRTPNAYFGGQDYTLLPNGYEGRVSHTFTLTEDLTGSLDAALVFTHADGTLASTVGMQAQMGDVLIEASPYVRPYFDGSTPGARWIGTGDARHSEQIISFDDQQILSNGGTYDGLSIEGTTVRFRTEYLTQPPSEISYDLGENRLAHVVGVHNPGKNELYVDGVLVGTSMLTDEQQLDDYKTVSDGWFYCGGTSGAQELAVNAVGLYASIKPQDIERNYLAGINRLSQDRISPQHKGLAFPMRGLESSVVSFEDWSVREEFEKAMLFNVSVGDEQVRPQFEEEATDGGFWEASIPLDPSEDTSIYGVSLDWSGQNISVATSIDGEEWVDAENGELVMSVPEGMNPMGVDLRIRVMFPPSEVEGESYLERLAATVMRDNKIDSPASRSVTVTHPAVPRDDYEPGLFRDSNGIYLSTGSLTIGPDESEGPDEVRTLEVWLKPVRGAVNLGFSGTRYRNGALDSTLPVGEWSLVHIVAPSDVVSAITISGDCIVGQVTLYSDPLTAAQITHIWKSYCGTTAFRVLDETVTTIAEGTPVVTAYSRDWAISASG